MTEIQAFRIGRAVYGIQFHCEADQQLVRRWNRDFAEVIANSTPDWPERFPREAARNGPRADTTGLALARAWVKLVGRESHARKTKVQGQEPLGLSSEGE